MNAAAPIDSPASAVASLFQPRWRGVLAVTLLGLLIGSLWWFVQPNDYRATATVLINPLAAKQLGAGSEVVPVRTIENEKLFATSAAVQSPVEIQVPGAIDAMTVTIDDKADALRFTAATNDAQSAEQIASIWASTFVTERRKALVDNWTLSAEAIQREVEALTDEILANSAAGNQEAINNISVRRDAVLQSIPEINAQLSLLRGSTAAEFLGPVSPAARSREAGLVGRALRGSLFGLLLGLGLAAAFGGPILPKKKLSEVLRTFERTRSPAPATPTDDNSKTETSPPIEAAAAPVVDLTPAATPAAAPDRSLELPSYLREALAPTPTQPAPAPAAAPAAIASVVVSTATTVPAVEPSSPPPAPTAAPATTPTPKAPAPKTPAPETPAPVDPEPQRARIAPVPDAPRRPAKPRLRRVDLDPPGPTP